MHPAVEASLSEDFALKVGLWLPAGPMRRHLLRQREALALKEALKSGSLREEELSEHVKTMVAKILDGEAPHLDVVRLADDHGMEPGVDQPPERLVGPVDQRAGGLEDPEARGLQARDASVGGPMRGDDHVAGGDVGGVVADEHPPGAQVGEDRLVVDQVAEDRHRSGSRPFVCQLDGVTDAEAHAHRLCSQDRHRKLCVTKCLATNHGFCSKRIKSSAQISGIGRRSVPGARGIR